MSYSLYIKRFSDEIKNIDGKIALAFSHQVEDVIAIDMLIKSAISLENVEFFTLDTKRLFDESLKHQKEVETFFGITINSYKASDVALKELDDELGEYGMRFSLEGRKKCCSVRKIEPLKNALKDKSCWISGVRLAQSPTRSGVSFSEEGFGIKKINPLFDFSDEQVWEYIKENSLPQNSLYKDNFLSIGCKPCTRAIKEGEDIRAGRWWWENPEHKECGLHR